jgi:hypothetical protein
VASAAQAIDKVPHVIPASCCLSSINLLASFGPIARPDGKT